MLDWEYAKWYRMREEDVLQSVELVLPRLVGSRDSARALLAELGTYEGKVVVLNARNLRSASPSAADEFVKEVLTRRHARALEFVSAGPEFVRDLEAAARAHHVTDRVHQPSLS